MDEKGGQMKSPKQRVVQRHHLVYGSPEHPEQERVVSVFAGEHQILSMMNLYTRKTVSEGFVTALKVFIALNESRAIPLDEFERGVQPDGHK